MHSLTLDLPARNVSVRHGLAPRLRLRSQTRSKAQRLAEASLAVQRESASEMDLQDAIFDAARRFDVAPATIWRELPPTVREQANLREAAPSFCG
jgi:hypothetical protein